MTTILSKYTEEYAGIRVKPEYAFGLAQSFVATLLALPPNERYELLPLFKQIENDVFEDGFELPNLKYEELEKEKAIWQNKKERMKPSLSSIKSLNKNFRKLIP